ncbi:MAG: trigger factor [Verrucomicrobiae bacterium]|nr:trigger factor [Verrucomicrobiae bacterium]
MNIVVEKQPKCVATLSVEIPAETVRGERETIVSEYARKARVPGFRPGKAPRTVVEKRFSKQISEELNEKLINEAFDEALRKEELRVLDFGAPRDVTELPDGGMRFISTLMLAPDFQLPEYKGIAVTVPPLEVPEEDLQSQLENLRERFADFNDIEDRASEMGDFAVIDYHGTVDGKPVEEFLGKPAGYLAGREGFWVKLSDEAFLPGFASQAVGMKPGDSKDITVTIPDDFPVEDLRGKDMTFATTVKELKQSVLPDLNDEFAARLAPGKSMEEITSIIRENLAGERKRKIDDLKLNQILSHLNDQTDFELPEELVTHETQSQADALVRRGVEAGMSEQEIQSQQDEIFASAGQQAVGNLRTNFILQEIARNEGIRVSDAELVNHLAAVAQSRKQAPKKFIKEMSRAGRLPSVRNSIAIGKAIDFLVENAMVTESAEAKLED